jgi:hypothetical protein
MTNIIFWTNARSKRAGGTKTLRHHSYGFICSIFKSQQPFLEPRNESEGTVSILYLKQECCNLYDFYLVSNRNNVTVTFCGNNDHLWIYCNLTSILGMSELNSMTLLKKTYPWCFWLNPNPTSRDDAPTGTLLSLYQPSLIPTHSIVHHDYITFCNINKTNTNLSH